MFKIRALSVVPVWPIPLWLATDIYFLADLLEAEELLRILGAPQQCRYKRTPRIRNKVEIIMQRLNNHRIIEIQNFGQWIKS